MATFTITIQSGGDPSPADLSCKPGDKINWKNSLTVSITSFSLPSCVSPQTSPAPIAAGATTRNFTVNNNASGDFSYSYTFPSATGDTRGGTIDVGTKPDLRVKAGSKKTAKTAAKAAVKAPVKKAAKPAVKAVAKKVVKAAAKAAVKAVAKKVVAAVAKKAVAKKAAKPAAKKAAPKKK